MVLRKAYEAVCVANFTNICETLSRDDSRLRGDAAATRDAFGLPGAAEAASGPDSLGATVVEWQPARVVRRAVPPLITVPDPTPPGRDSIAQMIEEALDEPRAAPADTHDPDTAGHGDDAAGFDPSQALDFGNASSRRPSVAVGLGGRALRALYAPVASPRRAVLLLLLLGAIAWVAHQAHGDHPRAFDELVRRVLDAVHRWL